MKFKKAYLKIGDKKVETSVDNNKTAAVLEMEVPAGKTNLLAYFDMENGKTTNAFYVDVEKIE